jgi:hypothetical protein
VTDLEVYRPRAELAPMPAERDIDSWIAVASDVIKIAKVIYDTPFVPDGLRGSEPAVAAAILAGRELGLGPMTSLANVHVIKGKPALAAVLMRALIQAQGHQWQDGDVTDTRAVVRGRRKGEAEWTEVTFTADQAKRAGIDLGRYPQDKLYARATSRLARRKFADVIAGMPYSAEELEDGTADEGTVSTPAQPDPDVNGARPRTAQRKQRTQTPAAQQTDTNPPTHSSAQGSSRSTTAEPPVTTPPLPGEDDPDDTDYDTPGTATPDQLTALWATFTQDFEFTKDDKAEARAAVEKITGRTMTGGTTADLSRNEASTAIDTLKRCGTRARLMALLVTGEMPEDGSDE